MAKETFQRQKSEELLDLYRGGARDVADAIYDRYAARLAGLAAQRIGPSLRRRFDPEDVVLSAFRSFFVGEAAGRYEPGEPGDLWRLLAGITLNKLHGQIEKQTAAKREPGREVSEGVVASALACEPSASEIAAAEESLRKAIDGLSPEEQTAFAAIVAGQSPEELGATTGKAPRTVRRLLANVRMKVEARLFAEADVDEAAPPILSFEDIVLEELLGAGGMGKVFRARLKGTGRRIAVKALHKARQADRRAVLRFAQEARLLTRLKHPHIVGVRGLGRFPGGGYFLAMDFIDGFDLENRLTRGPLACEEALRIARSVAQAVAYIHDRGVVHSDLKPANILLGNEGGVYVADFGFACLLATDHTAYGIGGAPGFIAPEVLAGETSPTVAADVYSFGALLARMATRQQRDDVSLAIERIADRCLATRPSERIATFRELLAALDTINPSPRSSRARRN